MYQQGRSWANVILVLRVRPNEVGFPRWGFAIGRRIGKAVRRNRLRRRLREVVRKRMAGGWDLVLIARPGAAEASFDALARAFGDLLQRARLAPQA
ncbi:MAG: ribonuclease P protein component [Chloroflexi bacterium]|nr:ribonuclease P protein component [Chloroflexota bacterium]